MFKHVAAVALAALVGLAHAEPAKVMIPAGAGGGWDGTGRLAFDVLNKSGIFTEGASFTNKGGAAGTLGLADFIKNRGQDNAVMVMGVVMVGGIITNKSPVTLDTVTPLARLTYEFNVIAVPADSPIKNMQDFVKALKADPGAMAVAGGSAGGQVELCGLCLGRGSGDQRGGRQSESGCLGIVRAQADGGLWSAAPDRCFEREGHRQRAVV
jgi:putative tricarboxylic transport membrane protein